MRDGLSPFYSVHERHREEKDDLEEEVYFDFCRDPGLFLLDGNLGTAFQAASKPSGHVSKT